MSNSTQKYKFLKSAVIGDEIVPKKALIYSYIEGKAPEFVPTVIEYDVVQVNVEGLPPVSLKLGDSSGQEQYVKLRPLLYPQTDVFLFCFSLVRPETLKNIDKIWLREVQEFCPNTPYLLVGLESELRDDFDTKSDELKAQGLSPVSTEEGQRMADKIHACCYMECSITKYMNVPEVFEAAVKYALNPPQTNALNPPQTKTEGGCCEVF